MAFESLDYSYLWENRYARIFTNYNDKNNSFPEFLEKLDVFKFQDTVSENQYGIESYVLEHLFSIGCLSDREIDAGSFGNRLTNEGIVFLYQNLEK